MTGNYLPQHFNNRELSWLEFNERVLEEANDKLNNPLFERLKFASIVSSNLDEFFMVRVASLYDQTYAGFDKPDIAGMTPKEQLKSISKRAHTMVSDQYICFHELKRLMEKEGVIFPQMHELNNQQLDYIKDYYNKSIYPVLTPMVVDQSRPFPLILNKSLNIALILESSDEKKEKIFATVQVPSVLKRIVELPCNNNKKAFMLLEDIIGINLDTLFNGYSIIKTSCYRITRNADQGLDEEGAEDLLQAIEQFLKKRKWGSAVRLEVIKGIDTNILNFLIDELEVPVEGVYEIDGPLDLTFLMKISSMNGIYSSLKYPSFTPQPLPFIKNGENIFDIIKKGDVFMHHPYESFDYVVNLVQYAAQDPDVLAIKQTLYRVSGKSPLVEALAQAAENGKQVTVLVELKARFDEENNILWAKRLEMAGCHVIYGLVGLKTHCKILLIVRKENDGIIRYVHMGTGNYNDVTAKIYTDMGLMTADPYFGADASALFNMLSGYSKPNKMYKVSVAPLELREKFNYLIDREAKHAREGKEAHIIAKLNSLVDERIIERLYDAARAGVKIDLIVRGICCLKPGIENISDKIRVISIVGRFLEHSRIYYFYNNGDRQYYLSSADWMGRNLDRRVELLFPVEDPDIKKRLSSILDITLRDTVKARLMDLKGLYSHIERRGRTRLSSQEHFYNEALKNAKSLKEKSRDEIQPNI